MRNRVLVTMGQLIASMVTPRVYRTDLLPQPRSRNRAPSALDLEKLYTDGAHGGKCAHDIEEGDHMRVEAVRHPGNGKAGTPHERKKAAEQAAPVNAGWCYALGYTMFRLDDLSS
jgi:putative transposase